MCILLFTTSTPFITSFIVANQKMTHKFVLQRNMYSFTKPRSQTTNTMPKPRPNPAPNSSPKQKRHSPYKPCPILSCIYSPRNLGKNLTRVTKQLGQKTQPNPNIDLTSNRKNTPLQTTSKLNAGLHSSAVCPMSVIYPFYAQYSRCQHQPHRQLPPHKPHSHP